MMKDLTQIAKGINRSGITDHKEIIIDDLAKNIINKVFDQLAKIFPAWQYNWKTQREIDGAKMEWIKAFNENNICTMEQISCGFFEARKCEGNFLPSCGKFISWCLHFDTTDAYSRMINRKPVLDDVEYFTRQECGYQCKRVLADKEARALFNKVFKQKLELKRKGKLPIRDQKLLATESVVTEIDKQISIRKTGQTAIEKRMAKIAKNRIK